MHSRFGSLQGTQGLHRPDAAHGCFAAVDDGHPSDAVARESTGVSPSAAAGSAQAYATKRPWWDNERSAVLNPAMPSCKLRNAFAAANRRAMLSFGAQQRCESAKMAKSRTAWLWSPRRSPCLGESVYCSTATLVEAARPRRRHDGVDATRRSSVHADGIGLVGVANVAPRVKLRRARCPVRCPARRRSESERRRIAGIAPPGELVGGFPWPSTGPSAAGPPESAAATAAPFIRVQRRACRNAGAARRPCASASARSTTSFPTIEVLLPPFRAGSSRPVARDHASPAGRRDPSLARSRGCATSKRSFLFGYERPRSAAVCPRR